MKKLLLSAAAFAVVAVSTAVVSPNKAEAIPAFARQTGAACLSCHFQTFPAINAMGRAFKQGAFTDVGDQALVEDDGLSIPSTLNATFVLRAQYSKTKATGAAATTTLGIPADTVLLMAGRVGENMGAFVEFNGGAANWQLMTSFDMGSAKVGFNVQNTGFGPTAAIETSNVFGQHGGKLNGKALSAIAALTSVAGGNSVSLGAWAGNDMGTAQLALVGGSAIADVANGAVPVDAKLATLVRVFATPEVGDIDLGVGFGLITGKMGTKLAPEKADALFVDFQAQGEFGEEMSYGVYADWARNKGDLTSNVFGAANTKANGYSARVEIKPTHHLMFGLGYGANTVKPLAAGVSTKTTKTQFAATYEVYQNAELNFFYLNSKAGAVTTKKTFFEIEALM